ncbi:MAG: DUF3048 domain-containing protein [Lachnospiraceae bacterium]|nr:DUF3048 domain-containing protein [Lachnospiraceae bacterium]
MKKRISMLLLSLMFAIMMTACGKEEETVVETPVVDETVVEDTTEETETTEVVEEINTEGMYRSELTNEWIPEELKDQRPVAVMVDNDKRALPHYGISEADVVYEMMNSTHNNRVTRLMVLVKDWESIERLGSIRSLRPTNIMLASEWNAVVCHDGGPYHNDAYLAKGYTDNLSGGFARIENGKPREFTEYITTGEIADRIDKAGYSREYNKYANEEPHFQFASESEPVNLEGKANTKPCDKVTLPFRNNNSYLVYNEESQTYDYFEHGGAHIDANNNVQTTFKNVIIQDVTFAELDDNGYMVFNCIGQGRWGWYITNGTAMQITWEKLSENGITRYYDFDGNEITINTGKTYIALCPDDDFPYVGIIAE